MLEKHSASEGDELDGVATGVLVQQGRSLKQLLYKIKSSNECASSASFIPSQLCLICMIT